MSQCLSAEEPSVMTLKTATARPAVVVRDANIIYPSADRRYMRSKILI
ncbi:hypothetical protein [Lonsdalea iberica]|nr:hypothetical protein [Lonsdalea iberica]